MRSFSQVFGVLLVVVGVVALFGTLTGDLAFGDVARILVPLLILALGAWILYEAATRKPSAAPPSGSPPPPGWTAPQAGPPPSGIEPPPGSVPPAAPPPVRYGRIAGEIELAGPMSLAPVTQVETLLGQIRLDLTQAVPASPESVIRVNGLVGEIRVLLPSNVSAIVRAGSLVGDVEVFGRIEGPFLGQASATTDDLPPTAPLVRIDAHTLVGQVAVRRARPSGG